ncbi:MAG: hypothetical protein GX259_11115 [Bacteroidales bacterium]|nr:hypothetical protein [Bacteroidales bacterium]
MKKIVLFSILITSAFLLNVKAQDNVGIGTTSPHATAALDITATNKGLLIPRVALSSTTLINPITTTPATGLLVYNTATAGAAPNNVVPGFYYWNGTKWVQVGASAPSCVKLDEAYDCGGAGAGRTITADAGAVEINVAASVPIATTKNALLIRVANGTTSNAAIGISATHSGGGPGYAIFAENTSSAGSSQGLKGSNTRTSGGWGVEGVGYNGVYGESFHEDGFGIRGENKSTYNTSVNGGVAISGYGNVGLRGESQNVLGAGVVGVNIADPYNPGYDMSIGVLGHSNNGCGLVGIGGTANALGLSVTGNSEIDGHLYLTGNITKGGGTFKIDHPLDPKNKYLYHSFVESPDMLNIYNGNVELNSNGTATITLPSYFDALNMDVKYQLTAIGGAMPNLHVSKEVSAGKFEIAGGKPNGKVSWQVTGIRQDPYANANRIVPEVEKEEKNKGKYLHPEAYGQSIEQGIHSRFSNSMKEKSNVGIMEFKK